MPKDQEEGEEKVCACPGVCVCACVCVQERWNPLD